MDHFLTMRSFVEVVKKGSYTQAANSMGTSRALVSRHILDLEDRLGLRLLNRTTRSVSLTDSGQQYHDFCSRILTEINEKEQEISGQYQEAEGNLSVVAPKWIGNYEIADAATSFSLDYPAISLKLSLGGMAPNAYDFIDQGYDVSLHTRSIPDSLIRARKIATIEFKLCASPEYLASSAKISMPNDLMQHRGLIQSNDPVWRMEIDGDSQKVRIPTAFSSNTYLVLRKAALKGIGLAILPTAIVTQDFEEDKLVQVLPECPIESRSLFAAFAPGSVTPMKVRLFVDYLASWFKKYPL